MEAALEPGAGRLRTGRIEDLGRRAGLHDTAGMHEDHVVGEPSRLPEIVGYQDDGDPAAMRLVDELFDRVRRGRIQARGRLVEQEHPGCARERTDDREPLLLTRGKDPGGPMHHVVKPRPPERLRFPRRVLPSAHSAHRQREAQVGEKRSAATLPDAGTPSPAPVGPPDREGAPATAPRPRSVG